MFFFRFRVPSRTQHHISLSRLLRLLLALTVFQPFLVFLDFDSFEEQRADLLQAVPFLKFV